MSLVIVNSNIVKKKSQKIETDIFNYRSKELFINLKESDIPPIDSVHREDFLLWEEKKSTIGVTVNGVFIPPTLYFDFNHFAILKDPEDRDEAGNNKRILSKPDLRDNDWIIHNALYDCEKDYLNIENLALGTARQISKTKNMASVFSRDLLLFDNRHNLLVVSEEKYITSFINYVRIGTQHCTPFFKVPILTDSKTSDKMEWGVRTSEGDEKIVKSTLHLRNTQEGRKHQAAAGLTIDRAFLDEVAIYPFQKSYDNIRPTLRGGTGFRSANVVAFTGGDALKSQQIEKLYRNPRSQQFKAFENEGKETGLFLDGTYSQDFKEWSTVGEWLNIKEDNEISNLKIKVRNLEKATERLDAEESTRTGADLILQRMYFPRKIDDMFLTPNVNPFTHLFEGMEEHKQKLLIEKPGTAVELYKGNDGKVHYRFSSKIDIDSYPTSKDANKDTPVIIYDWPKYEKEYFGLTIMDVDPINDVDATDTDSLAAIYLMRRRHSDMSDPYKETIVAKWVGRTSNYLRIAELLQEFYNSEVLFENSGNDFKQYFESRKKYHVFLNTYDLQRTIFPKTNIKATVGIKATPKNLMYGLSSMKRYLEEELDDGCLGYTRILDPILIDEIKAFDGFGEGSRNVDRFMAFLWQCVHIEMYYKYNPIVTHQKENDLPLVKTHTTAFGKSGIKKIFGSSGGKSVFGPRKKLDIL